MSEKLKFQKTITNESTPKKALNYKLRQAVAGTALAALGVVGAVKGLNAMDNSSRNHYDKIEQAALNEIKNNENAVTKEKQQAGRNVVIALHEGAVFRTAPTSVNSNGNDGPDTVAGRVAKGETLRIDQPVVYVERGVEDKYDVTWYGFTQSQKGDYKDSSAPENMFWVNATELGRQSNAEHDYIDVYHYHNTNPTDFDVVVDKAGNLLSGLSTKNAVAATASAMPEQVFEQMVANEHLELSAGN